MKLAFCMNVFRDDELVPAAYRLAELGYHGVEIWQRQIEWGRWPIVRAAVRDAGLSVAQLCPYFNLVNGEEKIAESVRLAGQYVELAAGCEQEAPPLIRVFTGPLANQPGAVTSGDCDEATWAQAVAGMRRICELGAAGGVGFALETHHGTLVDTSASILRFIGDVGCDNLGANLQVPLAGEEDDVLGSARRVGPHVVHLHANNNDPKTHQHTFLGAEGALYDFEAFLRAVRAGGPFDGYVSVEHAYHHPVWQTAVVEAGYLRDLLERM